MLTLKDRAPEAAEPGAAPDADAALIDRRVLVFRPAALLIAWCHAAGIPMPARATKLVTVQRGGVLLHFTSSFTRPPRALRGAEARRG